MIWYLISFLLMNYLTSCWYLCLLQGPTGLVGGVGEQGDSGAQVTEQHTVQVIYL